MSIATTSRKRAWWRVKEIAAYRAWRKTVKRFPNGNYQRTQAYAEWKHCQTFRKTYDRQLRDLKKKEVRNLSNKGYDFIVDKEGKRNEPYNDSARHATIGVGHLIHRGPVTDADRRKWGRLTDDEVEVLFNKDVDRFEKVVNEVWDKAMKNGHPGPTQAQFDADVSFALNIGEGGFRGSDHAKAIIAGKGRRTAKSRTATGNLMMNWVNPPELWRRRDAERDLFNHGTYNHINS